MEWIQESRSNPAIRSRKKASQREDRMCKLSGDHRSRRNTPCCSRRLERPKYLQWHTGWFAQSGCRSRMPVSHVVPIHQIDGAFFPDLHQQVGIGRARLVGKEHGAARAKVGIVVIQSLLIPGSEIVAQANGSADARPGEAENTVPEIGSSVELAISGRSINRSPGVSRRTGAAAPETPFVTIGGVYIKAAANQARLVERHHITVIIAEVAMRGPGDEYLSLEQE